MKQKHFLRFLFVYLLSGALLLAATTGLFSLNVPMSPETVSAAASLSESRVIVLDAGHGGEDSGTVGVTGVYEKDLNLQMAECLRDILSAAGYRVVMTRTQDRLLYTEEQDIKGQRKAYDLRNRLAISESYENAWLISLHMNSFSASSSSGLQVFYSENETAKLLADTIQKRVVTLLEPTNNRKAKPCNSTLYLLDRSDNPALLIECGFLSNPTDCKKLSDPTYQKELCFVIFCAMMEVENSSV